MTAARDPTSIATLPATLPIFPLPGVLLLPRGRLPLNIFELRYLAMTEDALGTHRLIGMIQPEDPDASLAPLPPGPQVPLYRIGCAGRIVQFSETDDGRYLITLQGVCRFRMTDEPPLSEKGYRTARASWSPFAADLDPAPAGDIARPQLQASVKAYFERKALNARWETIESASDDALVTALAMACPFAPSEKQALLQSPDLGHRATLLRALLDMDARATAIPDTKPQ
ncbi:MAG: peptidase S16 [Alphaproteobacteria bacterium]|nr:peptidase S16 [Alphaproteobacteria bacterium]